MVYFSIGETQTGKTSFGIALMKSMGLKHVFVNDEQHEPKYDAVPWLTKVRCTTDRYIQLIGEYHKPGANVGFIIEEARNILPIGNNTSVVAENLQRALIGKRFNHNVYLANFHSLDLVPKYARFWVDYYIIRKSEGVLKDIQSKFAGTPHIIESWIRCQNDSNFWYCEIVKRQLVNGKPDIQIYQPVFS
jgi:hypothetical protein